MMSLHISQRAMARRLLVTATKKHEHGLKPAPTVRSWSTRQKTTTTKTAASKSTEAATISSTISSTTAEGNYVDPQLMSQEYIQFSSARKPGTESILELTQTQRLSNYALALSLMGFVTWVWYYSMTSVGQSGGGIEQLMNEAEDARDNNSNSSSSDQEVGDMLRAEMNLGNVDRDDYGKTLDQRNLSVAVAAPENVAREEESKANANTNASVSPPRPLWKKIVLFWRRD